MINDVEHRNIRSFKFMNNSFVYVHDIGGSRGVRGERRHKAPIFRNTTTSFLSVNNNKVGVMVKVYYIISKVMGLILDNSL